MSAISTTPQTLDSTRAYTIAAKKSDGTAYVFAGDEALACALSAVGGGPALATPDVAFLVAGSGTLTVTVRSSQVAGLGPGTYALEVTATPASGTYSGEPLSVWSGTIALEAAASPAAATAGWTVRKLETVIARKRRAWLASCAMDFAASGSNTDLAGPLAAALRFAGGTVSDPVRPADADLITVPADAWDAVLDVADYLAVEAIVGNQDSVTMQDAAGRMAAWSDWSRRAEVELARLEAHVRRAYGYGLRRSRPRVAPLAAGSAWPPAPPPPAGIGPYPPGSGPDPDATFNP